MGYFLADVDEFMDIRGFAFYFSQDHIARTYSEGQLCGSAGVIKIEGHRKGEKEAPFQSDNGNVFSDPNHL